MDQTPNAPGGETNDWAANLPPESAEANKPQPDNTPAGEAATPATHQPEPDLPDVRQPTDTQPTEMKPNDTTHGGGHNDESAKLPPETAETDKPQPKQRAVTSPPIPDTTPQTKQTDMNPENTASERGITDRAPHVPSEPKVKDEAAVAAAPPEGNNQAGHLDQNTRKNTTIVTASGTPGIGADPPQGGKPLSLREQILRARKTPEEVARSIGTRNEQLSAPLHRVLPDESFWRVRDDVGWHPTESQLLLLRLKGAGMGRELLLIPPELESVFHNDRKLASKVTYYFPAFVMDSRGGVGWWAVPSQSDNEWHVSARAAMYRLMDEWGMTKSNMNSKCYNLESPADDLGKPVWPAGSYDDWFVKGFSDKVIDSPDHPVLRELQGRK